MLTQLSFETPGGIWPRNGHAEKYKRMECHNLQNIVTLSLFSAEDIAQSCSDLFVTNILLDFDVDKPVSRANLLSKLEVFQFDILSCKLAICS